VSDGVRDVGILGDAVAAVEEARSNGYSTGAALQAALAHLEGATAAEAISIAAVLAAWIAVDLNPTVKIMDLGWWLGIAADTVSRPRDDS
jgi:hypothetical protein